MYTAVLMLAMSSGAESVDFGRRGCNGCSGCYAACSGRYYSGCSGNYSGCCGGYRSGYYSYNYAPGYSNAPSMAMQGSGIEARQSFYRGSDGNGAMIRVMVPNPDAEIWFDNTPTKQRGIDRMFRSPPLDGNGRYSYTIKGKWMDNGRAIEQERSVQVQPGQPVMVDFRVNPGEKLTSPKSAPEKKLPKSSPPNESK
jgi:uncharacterized protein (TIGR03000 family)